MQGLLAGIDDERQALLVDQRRDRVYSRLEHIFNEYRLAAKLDLVLDNARHVEKIIYNSRQLPDLSLEQIGGIRNGVGPVLCRADQPDHVADGHKGIAQLVS